MTRILVIDDEALLSEEVVEWLTLEGYETASASDGAAGIDQAFRHPPDLIICDITMPHLDGHGVLLELRANPSTAAIPFIFVTARASHEDVRRGMNLGADDYITKPFTRAELLQTVQTRLEKQILQHEQSQHEVEQLQRVLSEEHERRMLKARMVAMFSHDFRNPLASIQSSSGLLRNYADRMEEKRRMEHFDRIDASVHLLSQMLEDMLVVAQMETGSLNCTPQPFAPESFFQSIVEEFRLTSGRDIHLVYRSGLPALFMADPRLLRQIAANLISNAIKYSPPGKAVRVEIAVSGKELTLTVQDNGIGIPERDQARLFQAFQRASNVKDISGTGLGLAIVKQSAEAHGGTVHLESQVGSGTRFTVTIPC